MFATSTVSSHWADLVVHLTGLAVTAQDVPSAVTPMLDTFVRETEAEGSVMRRHTLLGQDFASQLAFLTPEAVTVIRHHHERWDGAGYPDGLAGDRIPLAARIFAVCDV